MLARSVNETPGLWVRFVVGEDAFWLQTRPPRSRRPFRPTGGGRFALVATVLGSVLIARLINQPLRELSVAASRIREGE